MEKPVFLAIAITGRCAIRGGYSFEIARQDFRNDGFVKLLKEHPAFVKEDDMLGLPGCSVFFASRGSPQLLPVTDESPEVYLGRAYSSRNCNNTWRMYMRGRRTDRDRMNLDVPEWLMLPLIKDIVVLNNFLGKGVNYGVSELVSGLDNLRWYNGS